MTSPDDSDRKLEKISVVVVEDDYYQAANVQRILEQAGATIVGPFSASSTAMESMEESAPDCAIIDLNLDGGGPSFDLARALKSRQIPILILSGYDRDIVPQDLQDITRLEKPIEASALVGAVQMLSRNERA